MTMYDKEMDDRLLAYGFFSQIARQFGCRAEIDIYQKTVDFIGSDSKLERLMNYLSYYLED